MSVAFHPPPRRLLIRGVNWLGDAVMTTPALLRLREQFPAAHIILFTPEKLADLWPHHPAINQTISFVPGENIFAIGKKLRALKCELALVLPNSVRSALEVWLAGIPQRAGYARPWRNSFLTQTVAARVGAAKMHKRSASEIRQLISQGEEPRIRNPGIAQSAHHIHEYLHLGAALGADPGLLSPQLIVLPEEMAKARTKFELENVTSPVLGLNPGAEYGPAKRWPVEKFIVVAQEIQRLTQCTWILFGGQGDVGLTARIASKIRHPVSGNPALNLAGKTSLRELMSLLKLCRLLLTNDSGPMHVATALGTPVVAPFGSTSPELTAPGLPGDVRNHLLKSDAPCSPCFLSECPIDFRCMNGISVESVVRAVMQVLKE